MHSATDGCVKIAVKRQAPAGRRAAFENRFGEIAGLGIKKRSALASTVTFRAVAGNAVAYVERFTPLSIPHELADVALLCRAGDAPQQREGRDSADQLDCCGHRGLLLRSRNQIPSDSCCGWGLCRLRDWVRH